MNTQTNSVRRQASRPLLRTKIKRRIRFGTAGAFSLARSIILSLSATGTIYASLVIMGNVKYVSSRLQIRCICQIRPHPKRHVDAALSTRNAAVGSCQMELKSLHTVSSIFNCTWCRYYHCCRLFFNPLLFENSSPWVKIAIGLSFIWHGSVLLSFSLLLPLLCFPIIVIISLSSYRCMSPVVYWYFSLFVTFK